jgi:hypothetical protein
VPVNFESFKCVKKQILEKHIILINPIFLDYKIRTWRPWERFLYILFDGAKTVFSRPEDVRGILRRIVGKNI